jgi:hypothetical protein
MAFGDAKHARIGGPPGTLGERSVHDQPPLGAAAVSLAKLELESATSPVEGSGRIRQVAHRMRRLVGRKGHGLTGAGHLARGDERGRSGQDEQSALFQQSD